MFGNGEMTKIMLLSKVWFNLLLTTSLVLFCHTTKAQNASFICSNNPPFYARFHKDLVSVELQGNSYILKYKHSYVSKDGTRTSVYTNSELIARAIEPVKNFICLATSRDEHITCQFCSMTD